jgi:hypothetical protein
MDMGGSEGVSVYAEAKGEYTKQLCQYMVPALQSYFLELLEEAKLKEADSRRLLLSFQTLLEGIADWNIDKVQRETSGLAGSTHCDYLEELITAVFIAHTKVLSAIRLTTKQKKLQITIPKLDHFLHRTLTECARLLWSNTYLFSTSGPAIERQKNLRQIETLLTDGVLQSIRSMLPVKNILREYLKEDSSDDEDERESSAVAVPGPSVPAESSAPAELTTIPPATPPPSPAEVIGAATARISDLSGVVISSADTPAIVPPVFTGMDTMFETNEGGDESESEDGDDEADGADEEGGAEVDGGFGAVEADDNDIQILDEPPVPLEEFEDLERNSAPPAPAVASEEFLPMEFETLE